MQLTAEPGFPHTRTRPVHWFVTGAALAAAVAAAAAVQPSGATASDIPPLAAAPDPAAAEYPLDCGPYDVAVAHRAELDLDGDGRPETIAAVHCDAGGGTPPHGVYLLVGDPAGGAPAVAETLVDPAEGMLVDDFELSGTGLTARLTGYSSAEVPRSSPDLTGEATWSWQDGRLVLDQASGTGGFSV